MKFTESYVTKATSDRGLYQTQFKQLMKNQVKDSLSEQYDVTCTTKDGFLGNEPEHKATLFLDNDIRVTINHLSGSSEGGFVISVEVEGEPNEIYEVIEETDAPSENRLKTAFQNVDRTIRSVFDIIDT